MRIIQNTCSNAMLHWSSCGPTFGSGNDLYIANATNKKSNPYYDIGNAYDVPPGQTNKFLAGSYYFKVSEIKLFNIIGDLIFLSDIIVVQMNHL